MRVWLTGHTLTDIPRPGWYFLPPPPPPSSSHPASCGVTTVNFSIAEEATSSQLAADWLSSSRAGCIESNCFAFHWGFVVWLVCGWDLSTARFVGQQRASRPWTWLGCQSCMTDLQPRQTPTQLWGEERGERRREWRQSLSELHSV